MSEILKEIKQWCKAIGDEQHRKKALRREKEVKHEAQLRVQVKGSSAVSCSSASMAYRCCTRMTSPSTWAVRHERHEDISATID